MTLQDEHPATTPAGASPSERDPGAEAAPSLPDAAETEVPAGFWGRFVLVATPFALLVAFFLADRWIRG